MKDDTLYLIHMLERARAVQRKVTGLTRAKFDADENLRLALVYLLQVIGEAARCVKESTRTQFRDIPWRQLTGMRHKIVHDYVNVNFDVAGRHRRNRSRS